LTQGNPAVRVLFLSNGYAEDLIAVTTIKKLWEEDPRLEIKALPLVGEGRVYEEVNIEILGPRKMLPSGGFAGFRPWLLIKDLAAGGLRVLLQQMDALRGERSWADLVVSVGDVFLVILSAALIKKPIIFLATAKSDHAGGMKNYYRIEKYIMRRLCRLVFARDERTASSLKKWGMPSLYVGNVMMDCLEVMGEDFGVGSRQYVVGILPGSKREAYDNLKIILEAVKVIETKEPYQSRVNYLLALAPSLSLEKLTPLISPYGWQVKDAPAFQKKRGLIAYLTSTQGTSIKIIQGRFGDVLNLSQVVIGLSGMGNEQAVGMGRPVVSFSGRGPQITWHFLKAQKQILGGAVSVVKPQGKAVAEEVLSLLDDPERRERLARMGKERIGGFGAAARLEKKSKGIQFLLAEASPVFHNEIARVTTRSRLPLKIIQNKTYDLMNISDLLITASGTATLEAALLGTPMIAIYKTAFSTWLIGKTLIKLPYVALPNIIAGEEIIPELIGFKLTVNRLTNIALQLLQNEDKLEKMKIGLRKVAEKLGNPGAIDRAARIVVGMVNSP